MFTFIERLWDKRVVPENEFEDSEDEESNSLHGVRYTSAVRHGRATKSNETGPSRSRTRGTVDVLPMAATKLQPGKSSASSNNGTTGKATDSTAEETTAASEKDGDVVMDAAKPASPPVSSASSSTHSLGASQVPAAAGSDQDTEMTEGP